MFVSTQRHTLMISYRRKFLQEKFCFDPQIRFRLDSTEPARHFKILIRLVRPTQAEVACQMASGEKVVTVGSPHRLHAGLGQGWLERRNGGTAAVTGKVSLGGILMLSVDSTGSDGSIDVSITQFDQCAADIHYKDRL
ncbi:hypothetical protein F2P81_010268 [Scophthalmus maximus]|uniref:Uncharacterized protein n=1 Tax=Scophthalmus maximus TaxID=52904 RepID=A0A6A4T2F4_SCOMX|nr:hypothetical protein F2P81_010268 [Scophthalmus maximus]